LNCSLRYLEFVTADTGTELFASFARNRCDCAVLDLGCRHVWLESWSSQRRCGLIEVPVVVFTGRELSAEETQGFTHGRSIVVKGGTPERLPTKSLFLTGWLSDFARPTATDLER